MPWWSSSGCPSQGPRGIGQIGGPATEIGGIEVIRYASRQNNRLVGIERAVSALPQPFSLPLPPQGEFVPGGTPRPFVTEWQFPSGDLPDGRDPNAAPELGVYVVPISLDVQGDFVDPSTTGFSEFVQILPEDENRTEWVQYDLIEPNRLIRANRATWRDVYQQLTRRAVTGQPGVLQITPQNTDLAEAPAFNVNEQTIAAADGFIGAPTQLEQQFPEIRRAREALSFRGPLLTRTTSWPHNAGVQVLPCHRFEIDDGNYGALGARIGRNDRVALVNGTTSSAGGRPSLDWHTVNWVCRRYGADVEDDEDPLGPFRFQLVGFKDPVAQLFSGPQERQDLIDSRITDRLLKFPSGELPSGAAPEWTMGGSSVGGGQIAGFVDEVVMSAHVGQPLLLDQTIDPSADQLVCIANRLVTPAGSVGVGTDLSEIYPQTGGLLLVDGEVMAFTSVDQGTFQIAPNGRGLLNTEPRGHSEGARVRLLTHWPVGFLASQVTNQDEEIPLASINTLPLEGGTVLMDQEVLHYNWVEAGGGPVRLGMPRWQELDAEDPSGRGSYRGLFRGRYGTRANGAPVGNPVIWFPFRHWDRHRLGAADPESAYFQFTHREAPVFYSQLAWDQEVLDSGVSVELLVRFDGRGGFDEDPEQSTDLLRFNSEARVDLAVPLNRLASMLEARFVHVYNPGALDVGVWLSQGWKTAPVIRSVQLEYEGEGRVLEERRTIR